MERLHEFDAVAAGGTEHRLFVWRENPTERAEGGLVILTVEGFPVLREAKGTYTIQGATDLRVRATDGGVWEDRFPR